MVVRSIAASWYHDADMRRVVVVLALALPLTACGGSEKQWYKPNSNYTVAEFEQDRHACTRNRELDESCLRGRGWISLSADGPVKDTTPQAPAQPQLRAK